MKSKIRLEKNEPAHDMDRQQRLCLHNQYRLHRGEFRLPSTNSNTGSRPVKKRKQQIRYIIDR